MMAAVLARQHSVVVRSGGCGRLPCEQVLASRMCEHEKLLKRCLLIFSDIKMEVVIKLICTVVVKIKDDVYKVL